MKRRNIVFVILLLFLTGCSNDRYDVRDVPRKGGWHHVTERPYVDRGKLYVPQLHYNYDRIGYASWYGEQFHMSKTALGDRFNIHALTAASRVLPLPCVARVKNLENGKSVTLIVNDRGPFHHTKGDKVRIIDVSKKAAEILGFKNKGVAKVRVTCLKVESVYLAKSMGRSPYYDKSTIHLASSSITRGSRKKNKSLLFVKKGDSFLAKAAKELLDGTDKIGNFIKTLSMR